MGIFIKFRFRLNRRLKSGTGSLLLTLPTFLGQDQKAVSLPFRTHGKTSKRIL